MFVNKNPILFITLGKLNYADLLFIVIDTLRMNNYSNKESSKGKKI